MFVYCKKCGFVTKQRRSNQICSACNCPMDLVPSEYLSPSGTMFASQALKKEFETRIKGGTDFDPQANLERDSILKQKKIKDDAVLEEKVAEYHRNRIKFTCPLCHSESISKISNVGKIVKVGVFGILGAGEIGKVYRCNVCGYKF